MNPAPTALEADRTLADGETGVQDDRPSNHRPAAGSRHGNSRTTTIAMILGAIGFMVCLALIAFGGDEAASEDSSVVPVSTSNETAIAEAAPANQSNTDAALDTNEPQVTPQDEASNDVVPTEAPVPEESDVAAADTNESAQPETDAALDTNEPQVTPQDEASPVDPSIESPPVPPGAPTDGYSVLSGGKIFLRGTVPTAQIEGLIVGAIEQVLGDGNVISEYVIDPTEPFDPDRPTPVFINDTIVFASGSAEIAPDFYPLIATTPVLLDVQPSVVVTITGHTDSSGGEAANLALSQARVDAVRDWIISQGGDGDRLVAVGKGETEPVADNSTEEGRQANRRVEFLIEGFDFTLGG